MFSIIIVLPKEFIAPSITADFIWLEIPFSKTIPFEPTPVYSGQCRNAVLKYFLPVVIYACAFESFMYPVMYFVFTYKLKSLNTIITVLGYSFPAKDLVLYDANYSLVLIWGDLLLLLTYGVISPLAAFAIGVNIYSKIYIFMASICLYHHLQTHPEDVDDEENICAEDDGGFVRLLEFTDDTQNVLEVITNFVLIELESVADNLASNDEPDQRAASLVWALGMLVSSLTGSSGGASQIISTGNGYHGRLIDHPCFMRIFPSLVRCSSKSSGDELGMISLLLNHAVSLFLFIEMSAAMNMLYLKTTKLRLQSIPCDRGLRH